MKKRILLATTAMLLSAIATKVNADSNSAILNMMVLMMKPFEITTESPLGFGMILETEAGRKVIVTPDGKLGEGSTATMLSTAKISGNGEIFSFSEAVFRIKGSLAEMAIGKEEDTINAAISVNFNDTSVELTDNNNPNKICGTVSDFTTRFKTADNSELLLHVGGTLTTEDLRENGLTGCSGNTTITIVFNDEAISYNGGFL